MSKFLSDDWMISNGFLEINETENKTWWGTKKITDLNLNQPITISGDVTIKNAIQILNQNGFDNVPVVDNDNSILGVISEGHLTSRLTSGKVSSNDLVSSSLYKLFIKIESNISLFKLSKLFDSNPYCILIGKQKKYLSNGNTVEINIVNGIVTRIDLLKYISQNENEI